MPSPQLIARYLEVLGPCAWPIVVLILAIFFRREIKDAFNRITGAKFPFVDVKMDHEDIPSEAAPPKQAAPSIEEPGVPRWIVPPSVNKKPTNLFWLAADLRWTQIMLAAGESRDSIANGLRQSFWHARELDIGTPIIERLRSMTVYAQKSLQGDWTSEKRSEYFSEINGIIQVLDNSLRQLQPGFRATEADPITETENGETG